MINSPTLIGRVSKVVFLGLCLIVTVFPLYWIVVTSLKEPGAIYSLPLDYWPKQLSLDNYIGLFTKSDFGQYMLNSLSWRGSSSPDAGLFSVRSSSRR